MVKGAIVIVLHWGELLGVRLAYDLTVIDQLLPRKGVSLFLGIIFIAAGLAIYRASLRVHAQFGELFKSIFDVNVGALNVAPIIKDLSTWAAHSPIDSLNRDLTSREQSNLAWRYMQFFRYRCPACNTLLKPKEIANHACLEFHVYQETSGSWRWRLETTLYRCVLVDHGVTYKSEKQCKDEIDLIRQSWNASVVEEEKERSEIGSLEPDKAFTARSLPSVKPEEEPPIGYVYYENPKGAWRWRIVASCGCIIADSVQHYSSQQACKEEIERVKNSQEARVIKE